MPVRYSTGLDNIFAAALIVLPVYTNIFQLKGNCCPEGNENKNLYSGG